MKGEALSHVAESIQDQEHRERGDGGDKRERRQLAANLDPCFVGELHGRLGGNR